MQRLFRQFSKLVRVVKILGVDSVNLCAVLFRSRARLAAENLFLRKQLALFQEREKKARPTTAADRFVLRRLACLFSWRDALVIVKPGTLIGRHRSAFRHFWRWKCLIRRMAAENPTWGEERIADELRLKLGIRVSPRTVSKYLKQWPSPRGSKDQRWSTFLRNHAHNIVACDFFVVVTARFRILYVFVVLEIGSRQIVHCNVTEHPTAEWTLQQLREAIPGEGDFQFLLHDRDNIFSAHLDEEVESWSIRVLKSPVRMPTANAHCERLIGTIRRERLDYVIPFGERHLGRILREWVSHYNEGRPHRSLGPGIPAVVQAALPACDRAMRPFSSSVVIAKPILGGLHHEYRWGKAA
ncbi:MAG: integrase core domain-containing protein [Bryobacteraceae bacterium]